MNHVENTVVCIARLLSSNSHISSNVDTIYLNLSTYAYCMELFHSKWSKELDGHWPYLLTTVAMYALNNLTIIEGLLPKNSSIMRLSGIRYPNKDECTLLENFESKMFWLLCMWPLCKNKFDTLVLYCN